MCQGSDLHDFPWHDFELRIVAVSAGALDSKHMQAKIHLVLPVDKISKRRAFCLIMAF